MASKEKEFYKKIVWFDKRIRYEIDFFEYLQPQRVVSKDPRYKSGTFFSEKCKRHIQYESGIELAFIQQLEQLKNVKFYYEQPVRINYWRGRSKQTYTPDFGVLLDTDEFILVEVKQLPGMLESRVQTKIEGLLDFCSQKGFGLLLTDGKNTIDRINRVRRNRKLEKEILQAIADGPLRQKECAELMKKHKATRNELWKIILKNNLKYKSYPFVLKQGKPNRIFHQVYVEKKRYDDLVQEKYAALFKSAG